MSLSGKTLKDTYIDLLQLDNSNGGVSTSLKDVKDGGGSTSCLSVSDDALQIKPQNDDSIATFNIKTTGNSSVLSVNTSSEIVMASGNAVNTQFATFSIGSTESSVFAANEHQAIPFGSANYSSASYPPDFGSGTDPATTYTTSNSSDTNSANLVPCIWYLPNAISIDSVVHLEGADAASGDTTRMHLFSYDFTSGATSCLTNGTLLAHNTDITNAGREQPYLSSWTVDSAAVAAGKVILAFFRSDSVNSDYALQVTVKYHLT